MGEEIQVICHISTLHQAVDNRIFRRECSSLAEAGYEVHFLVDEKKSYIKNDVHIHPIRRIPKLYLRMLFTNWVVLFKALKINADIYHYHDPDFLPFGFILKWLFRKKTIFDAHESVAKQILGKTHIPKFARRAVSITYKIVERITAIGQFVIVANAKSVHDYRKKVYVVQNYPKLDEELMISVSEERQRAEVPLLVFVGGVCKVRGADAYVELAGKLAERGHDFRMKIIGWNCNNCIERLMPRVKELNLQNKIAFTGGLEWSQAMKAMAEGTIGMCLLMPIPNNLILLSTKIIEYMMLGIPVLASNFDTWKPYVEGERTGMMADPTNINEVADVCEKMLSDRDELVAMGKRGMEAVRNKYNWESEFKVLLKCYDDLLNK